MKRLAWRRCPPGIVSRIHMWVIIVLLFVMLPGEVCLRLRGQCTVYEWTERYGRNLEGRCGAALGSLGETYPGDCMTWLYSFREIGSDYRGMRQTLYRKGTTVVDQGWMFVKV